VCDRPEGDRAPARPHAPDRLRRGIGGRRAAAPSDLKPVYDKSDTSCRDLQFQSATLATLLGTDDPDGVVNIELESALAPDFKYDGSAIDTAVIHQQYNLHETRSCLRG
jgi:hypothetical protein